MPMPERVHKIRTIFAIGKAIGMDKEMIEHVNKRVNKEEHISQLDVDQLEKLIRALRNKAGEVKRKSRPALPRNVIGFISLAQQQLIQDLLVKLGWAGNPKRYEGFCMRVLKKPAPATSREAQKVIEAFKNMITRNYGSHSKEE